VSTLFLRQFEHLLPSGRAWRLTVGKTLRKFFEGLAAGAPPAARAFIDSVYLDLLPDTTRELPEWERQFGIFVAATDTEAQRRQRIDAEWKATGGQSPHYLQTILQAAGFEVFVHEWWKDAASFQQVACGEPLAQCGEPRALASDRNFRRFVHDPRDYTEQPLVGTVQCGEPLAACGEPSALANAFLANEPGYLVNLNLTPQAPPAVPSAPQTWPFFLYVGGETFPERAFVPRERRADFERLVLKLRPAQQWVVTLIDFSSLLATEGGDELTTESGVPLHT
jgi:uncharacterized protein YmfQ (DUF2313 family)